MRTNYHVNSSIDAPNVAAFLTCPHDTLYSETFQHVKLNYSQIHPRILEKKIGSHRHELIRHIIN